MRNMPLLHTCLGLTHRTAAKQDTCPPTSLHCGDSVHNHHLTRPSPLYVPSPVCVPAPPKHLDHGTGSTQSGIPWVLATESQQQQSGVGTSPTLPVT